MHDNSPGVEDHRRDDRVARFSNQAIRVLCPTDCRRIANRSIRARIIRNPVGQLVPPIGVPENLGFSTHFQP